MIKKLSVIFLVLLMAGAMIVTTSGLQANVGILSCKDLINCRGRANCGGPGEVSGGTLFVKMARLRVM